jgi:hypothetical protein
MAGKLDLYFWANVLAEITWNIFGKFAARLESAPAGQRD